MARTPLRPCKEIGCNNLTRKSYCKNHEKNAQKIHIKYNQYKRDPVIDSFYKTADWVRLREVALARDNYLCQRCLKRGKVKQAQVVHHVVEVKEDWNKRLDLDNLESLCHFCHNREHKSLPQGLEF